jgi:hypothetical protein
MFYLIFNPAAPPQHAFPSFNMVHDGEHFFSFLYTVEYLLYYIYLSAYFYSVFVPGGPQQHALNMICPYKASPDAVSLFGQLSQCLVSYSIVWSVIFIFGQLFLYYEYIIITIHIEL